MIDVLLKYQDIEFDGDNLTGMDCAEFAKHFRRQEFGRATPLSVPDYSNCKHDLESVFKYNIELGLYDETENPKDGDLFLMSNRERDKYHHLGVYLNNGVIHCSENNGNKAGVQWMPLSRIGILFPYYTAYTDKDG